MRKLLMFLAIIGSILIYSQASSKLNNAQNVAVSVADPPYLVSADDPLSGLWRKYFKDDIRWEIYNINGIASYIQAFITWSELTGKPTTLSGYGITDAYPLTGNPSGFLTSFTEVDPTIPSYSKSLTGFNIIKSSTDPLYYPIGSNPAGYLTEINSGQVTTALGYTPYNGTTNPNSYVTSSSLSTTLGGYATTGALTSGLSGKENTITAGTTAQYWRGDKTWQTLPIAKRQETYSGSTNASGNYTVTFATAYSVAPNIQACLINPNVRDTPLVTSITTTGFTVNIQRRTDVIGLLPTYANVTGGAIDVLITEK